MGCPSNPKKFLGIRYNGSHDYIDDHVSRFGEFSWAKYVVSRKCSKCGLQHGDAILSEATMQRYGYDVKKLQKLSFWDHISADAKDLK